MSEGMNVIDPYCIFCDGIGCGYCGEIMDLPKAKTRARVRIVEPEVTKSFIAFKRESGLVFCAYPKSLFRLEWLALGLKKHEHSNATVEVTIGNKIISPGEGFSLVPFVTAWDHYVQRGVMIEQKQDFAKCERTHRIVIEIRGIVDDIPNSAVLAWGSQAW